MDAAYRVLGYGDNRHLSANLSSYLASLRSKFDDLRSRIDPGGTLSAIADSPVFSEFLSVPDVAASLWACSRSIEKAPLAFLCGTARNVLRDGISAAYQWRKIPGTDVLLTEIDANPYGSFDAHPDNRKDGVRIGWGGSSESEWFDAYARAFDILRRSDAWFFAEINRYMKKIVPLGTDDKAHRSASYAEAFGSVYMGLVPREPHPEFSVLEGLIHEWSHNKANLARNLAPLVLNGNEEAYYSSYRPDPRPIEGIFLGVHAFVPTVRVFLQAFDSGAIDPNARIAKVFSMHLKNESALEVLSKYLRPSEEGAMYLEEIAHEHSRNASFVHAYAQSYVSQHTSALETFHRHSETSRTAFPHIYR